MANASLAFQALGDPTRRELFERLSHRALSVVEITAGTKVSRPAVSQHLKVLKDAGLLTVRRQGTRRIYHVNPDAVEAMRDHLTQTWEASLQAFKDFAENQNITEKS